jgi:hypothetical protein
MEFSNPTLIVAPKMRSFFSIFVFGQSDDEQILIFKNRDSLISLIPNKNDDYDYSSDDTENIIDNSVRPDEILFDLQIYNSNQI